MFVISKSMLNNANNGRIKMLMDFRHITWGKFVGIYHNHIPKPHICNAYAIMLQFTKHKRAKIRDLNN